MHLLPRLAALLIASSLSVSVLASPEASPPLVRQVEGISEYRLPNGLQVLLIPDASKPTVTVNVTYRVGSRLEGPGETGMAHLLEHLTYKTTRLHANLSAELSKRGMWFNGSTDSDRTNYFETFPAQPELLSWALKAEADRMTGAKVLRKDLDSEMTVVRNEMEKDENDPLGILMQRTVAAAYQWHSYGRDTIGARADVENVAIPNLQAFYRKYYQPDNATLVVAGAFNVAQVLKEINVEFGRIPKPIRQLTPTYTLEPVQEGEREVTLRRNGGRQALFASYHIPALAARDYAAFPIVALTLAGTPNGRLHKRLVDTGKATQVVGWASNNAEPGLLNVRALLKKEDSVEEAQRIFIDTIEGLAKEPVTAEELQRAQRQWALEFDKTLADPQALCITLSEYIAAGDWRLLLALRDRVQAITLDEVNAAARAWVMPSNRNLGRLYATEAPQRTPLAERVDAEKALADFKPRAALAAGEVFDASTANIDKRTERYTLPSGLKVALLPKKTRGETVRVVLKLHFGNLESVQGKREVVIALGDMLRMGTQTKTRAQITDAFDALKTEWWVQSNALEGANAGLNTKRDQLVPAFTLLTEVLREPSFPASEFEQLVRQHISGLEAAAADPVPVASRTLEQALSARYPQGDPRRVSSFEQGIQALKALKLDDVKAFHAAQWGAEHAELAIVGDFDPAVIKPLIAQRLGHWRSPQAYARVPRPAQELTGLRLTALLKDKPNAMARGVLPLKLSDDDADYAALQLAVQVLGASGFDSRLTTRLRGKDGLSYGAGAGLNASSVEPAGSIGFFAIFAPENLAKVEQGFAEELQRFVKDGITATELANAKKSLQAAVDTRRANDADVAWDWPGHLELNRSFAWDGALEAKVQALTVEQVNAAIRKWIVPAHVNWSLAGELDKPAKP